MGFFSFLWQISIQIQHLFTHDYGLYGGLLSQDVGLRVPCSNGPKNRQCWHGDYNIHTDYEYSTPPGRVRKYDLTLTNTYLAPDGYNVSGIAINGQYPGPTIEGNWGDIFEITVHNRLTNKNGTSIHWHGIRQLNTNWEDGVAGVTQCPIPVGQSYTYSWRAVQYGASWYHSHFSLQYADGALGAIKIHGPTNMNYDVDIGPILISDWLHKDAFELYHLELEGKPPTPNSNLMNGKGYYPCCPSLDRQCTGKQPRQTFNFERGKTYKLSIVNTAVSTHFTFWIDGHTFSVVGTDFVPIQPYDTDTINVAIGQRYDIIVTANATFEYGKNFWIHARDCANVDQRSTLGIIRYDPSSTALPWSPPPSRLCYGCLDEPNPPTQNLTPVVPRNVLPAQNKDYANGSNPLLVALQGYPNTSDPESPLKKWILANSSLYLNWSIPSLSLINDKAAFPDEYAPIQLDFPEDTWVYFVIEGNFTDSDYTRYRKHVPVAHPIHLHGHDFVVLAQANETFTNNVTLKLDNPTRRDVALLPINGYLVIGFQMNNVGSWLMHCHIAWHASSGLAVQFVERAGLLRKQMKEAGVLPTFKDMCSKWRSQYDHINEPANATQEDSGI